MIFKKNKPIPEHEESVRAWLRSAQPAGMDAARKDAIRASLLEYTKLRPIRATAGAPSPLAGGEMLRFWRQAPAFALVAILVVTGGTAYAAEGALPGDPLYGVKTNVNEAVREAVAFTPKAKAEVAIARAERRLEEVSALAVRGTLTDENSTALSIALKKQLGEAEARAAAIAEEDNPVIATEVSSRIGAVVNAHLGVLSALEAALEGENRKKIASLILGVSSYAGVASAEAAPAAAVSLMATGETADTMTMTAVAPVPAARNAKDVPVQASTSDEHTAERERKVAELHIATAEKRMKEAERKLRVSEEGGNVWASAEAKLAAAKTAYAEGEQAVNEGDFAHASLSFRTAIRNAIEAQALYKARSYILNILLKANANTAPSPSSSKGGAGEPHEIEIAATTSANVTPVVSPAVPSVNGTTPISPITTEIENEVRIEEEDKDENTTRSIVPIRGILNILGGQ